MMILDYFWFWRLWSGTCAKFRILQKHHPQKLPKMESKDDEERSGAGDDDNPASGLRSHRPPPPPPSPATDDHATAPPQCISIASRYDVQIF